MKRADIPTRFPIPFANAAAAPYVHEVPEASQQSVTPGAASLTDGFPPANFTPISAGGTPPKGDDMNGILKQITQWSQWQAAAGPVSYDAAFSTSIGGYPEGTVLAATTTGNFWLSTVDDNMTDPDADGAGWSGFTEPVPVTSFTKLTTAGAGTYTTSTGVRQLRIRMMGAGGGGGGSGNPTGSDGSPGTATVFGAVTAAFGLGGKPNVTSDGGAGGATSGNGAGTAFFRIPSGAGSYGGRAASGNVSDATAGNGSASTFGGAGVGGTVKSGQVAIAAAANTGSGGGGGGNITNEEGLPGGGSAGEYVELIINSPAASYSYTVGTKGNGGAAGSGGQAGSNGADGVILIEEVY